MHETLPFLFGIIAIVVLVEMLADKLKIAYPILLVIAGFTVSIIPGVPWLKLDPDMIFFIFLPPLLFEASWTISFKEMKKWWRIIGSFSFLVVFFTAFSVAFFANHFIPGFTLALGFLLGGIVSPPDAVSAGAILKFVKVPKSTATILEGESLLNDASSLIIFRFALIAVCTGQFIWGQAIMSFSWMIFGGVAIGLLLGWLFIQAHKRLPTDASADIAFTLIEPYILYWVAEQMHSSGVLAVVSGGLLLSNQRLQFLTSESRVRGYSFWESFVFILNGIVFIIIGLDLPEVVDSLHKVGIPLKKGIYYGVLVTAFIIFIRIFCSYVAMLSTYLFRRSVVSSTFNSRQVFRIPLVLGWTGMRGVVSLASALSIPVYLTNGSDFPQRDLIIFISFTVIILTLFIQGLTLPFVLKRVAIFRPNTEGAEEVANKKLKKELWQYSIDLVQDKYKHHLGKNVLLATTLLSWQEKLKAAEEDLLQPEVKVVYIELLEAQRQFLIEKNKDPNLNEDIVRREIYLLDLEEEKIRIV